MHTEVLASLEAALAHLDEHDLALPAIHVSNAIEALQAHIDASPPGGYVPELEKN